MPTVFLHRFVRDYEIQSRLYSFTSHFSTLLTDPFSLLQAFRWKPVVSIRTQNYDHFRWSLQLNKKTFWVNILRFLSQVRKTKYTLMELTCIETTGNREEALTPFPNLSLFFLLTFLCAVSQSESLEQAKISSSHRWDRALTIVSN